MKKYSKLLILVLSLALVVCAFAISASADNGNVAEVNGTGYASIADAYGAAPDGATITLIGDASIGTITVNKNITIDLNGYVLTTSTANVFELSTNVALTIKGDGEINATGRIINATAGSPVVTIQGGTEGMKINANVSGQIFRMVANTTLNMTNVDMVSNVTNANRNVFDTDASSNVRINLKAVTIKHTGLASRDVAVFRLGGTSFLDAEYCRIEADGLLITVRDVNHVGDNVFHIKDSYLSNVNNKLQNGIAGNYADVKGLMKFERCTLDSSYRVFCFNCDTTSTTALVECVDTAIRMNGYYVADESLITRNVPVKLTGSSYVTVARNAGVYVGYRVQVDEGFRTNYQSFTTSDGFAYPDGSTSKNSTTYKFVYDPKGNQEAPYLLVKVGGELDKSYSSVSDGAAYKWYNNMERLWGNDYEGVLFRNDNDTADTAATSYQVSSTITGTGATNHWWHGFGTYEAENVNGNNVLKYWVNPTETVTSGTRTFKSGPNIPLMEKYEDSVVMTAANSKVMVMEVDVATDSAVGLASFSFHPHIRTTEGKDGAGGSSINVSTQGAITCNNFASVTEYGKTAALNMNGWNRLSIVIYTDAVNPKGIAYYYLNGNLLGTTVKVYADGTSKVYGPRFNIGNKQTIGASILIDNVSIARYDSYKASGEADGSEKNPAYYLSGYALNDSTTINTISVGPNNFSNLNDAMVVGNAIGVTPEIKANVTVPQKITEEGFVLTHGYTVELTDDSYRADVVYDENENAYGLDFNSKYSGEIPVYWYIGDLNDQNQLLDYNYYHMTTAKLGEVPSCDYEYPYIQLTDGDYHQLHHIGFSTKIDGKTLETIEPISMHTMNTVSELHYYPVYEEKEVFTWVVVDYETGEFKRGGTDTTLWNSNWTGSIKLGYGEILVACSDNFKPMGYIKIVNRSTEGVSNKIWGFDVNGHDITVSSLQNSDSIKQTSMFTVNAGDTVLLYSSRPGGKLTALGADNITDKIAGSGSVILFSSNRVTKVDNQHSTDILATHKVVSDSQTQSHTTVKVGAIDGKYSGNLLISSDSLVQAQSGDATSSINVEGITFVRNSFDNGFDIVRSEIYYGEITIKNCNIFNPVGGSLVNSASSRTVTDSETGTVYNATSKITFDDCYYLVKENGTNLVADNRGMDYVNFKNFVTNGRLNPSHKGCTYVYENVAANLMPASVANESFVKAAYNVPMQLPEGMTELTLTYYTYNPANANALISNTFKFLPYGSEAANGVTVLPLLAEITTTPDHTVDVTFKGLGDNADTVVKYVKGGNVQPIEIKDAALNAFKLVFTGFEGTLPKNVQEDTIVTPKYEVKPNVEGVKVNLSIYSDFVINLYIPVAYESYIASISNGSEILKTSKVTLEDVEYIKVVINRASNEATTDAVFTINLAEGEYTKAVTVTVSIASYAEAILEDESYTAADKQLMYYMLTYANEACKYFDKTENAAIAALLTTYADAKGEGMAEQTYAKAIENLAFGKVITEATVNLGSAPAFVFTVADGFEGTITVTYAGNSKELVVSGNKATVTGMKVYNFGADVTVTAEGTLNGEAVTETATYNLDTFVNYHVENAKTESETAEASKACVALLEALYDYVSCADLYTK